MIIDVILDRKEDNAPFVDGEGELVDYSPKLFYDYATEEGFEELARALDSGTEEDVKRILCQYIDDEEYDPALKDYINSVSWLGEEKEQPKEHNDELDQLVKDIQDELFLTDEEAADIPNYLKTRSGKDTLIHLITNGDSDITGYLTADLVRRIEDFGEENVIYLYQFPKSVKGKDLEEVKDYNLEYLGFVGPDGFQPGDPIVKGSYDDLKRYCDDYLGYQMHPDYLYREGDFDESVIIPDTKTAYTIDLHDIIK